MDLTPVISALRTRCAAAFSSRVAGAAQFQMLPESASLDVPCAFVLPMDDSPDPSISDNTVRQYLDERFAVVVALDNTTDERGQAAVLNVHTARAALWAALLGWQVTTNHNGINYEGGSLLKIDRARLWYQFEFSAGMEIGPTDGWQASDLATLPRFEGATLNEDVIDPQADPNVKSPGPDGRIEHVAQVNNLPT